jgi:hypothetical protein
MTVTRAIILSLLMLNSVTALKLWQYREAIRRKDQTIVQLLRTGGASGERFRDTETLQAPR